MGESKTIPNQSNRPEYPDAKDVIKHAPTAMFLLDTAYSVISHNNKVIDYLQTATEGTNLEEIFGNSISKDIISQVSKKENNSPIRFHNSNNELLELILTEVNSGISDKSFYLGTITKITEEKENLLQKLIDSIPDTIFIKDIESNFLLANNWVANIIGVDSPKELIGKNDFSFFPKQLAREYYKDERKVISTGKPLFNKLEKVVVRGKIRWYSTTKIPLKDSQNKITGIMGIGRDITQNVRERRALLKAKKEAEKADKLKSNFLANLSHEIRTPLNGILGFSQFLKQIPQTPEKTNKYLDIIHTNGRQLLMLINDIIDFSMIDSNQITIKKQVFRLNALLANVNTNFEHQLKQANHELKIYYSVGLANGDDQVFSDEFRINQILTNLLSNAIKFTPEGNIHFGYKIEEGIIQFYVADTGIGIKVSDQKEIFERFRQADESITRSYGGTGLGLSISKGLVNILGGEMWLDSKVNSGSTFYFTIPYISDIETEEQS